MLTGEKPDSAKFIAERQDNIELLVRQLEAGAKALAEEKNEVGLRDCRRIHRVT